MGLGLETVSKRCEEFFAVSVLASPSFRSFIAEVIRLSKPGLSLTGRRPLERCEGGGASDGAETPRIATRKKRNKKVDGMLRGKENRNAHGARPVHIIIMMF